MTSEGVAINRASWNKLVSRAEPRSRIFSRKSNLFGVQEVTLLAQPSVLAAVSLDPCNFLHYFGVYSSVCMILDF